MVVSQTVLGVLQTTLCANAVEVPIRHSKLNSIAFFFIIRCICFSFFFACKYKKKKWYKEKKYKKKRIMVVVSNLY